MSRTYARDAQHYDRTVLDHLVLTGGATFFAAANVYVVKTETGSFAVRPHQIVEITTPLVVEVPVASPMDGYHGREEYDGEDTGPGGVVYDSALELAERVLARRGDTATDPLILVRRILDDRSYERQLREELETSSPRRFRSSWYSADEAEELLNHFIG